MGPQFGKPRTSSRDNNTNAPRFRIAIGLMTQVQAGRGASADKPPLHVQTIPSAALVDRTHN